MTFEYVLKKNGINPQTDVNLDDSIKFDLMAGAFTGGNAEYVTLCICWRSSWRSTIYSILC